MEMVFFVIVDLKKIYDSNPTIDFLDILETAYEEACNEESNNKESNK